MATKTVLTCDVDGDDTEAEETVRFGLDGREYEVELCTRHHNELNGALRSFVDAGRRVDHQRPRRRVPRQSGASSSANTSTPRSTASKAAPSQRSRRRASTANISEMRQWGRAHGMQVSDRGRISQELADAYKAANN